MVESRSLSGRAARLTNYSLVTLIALLCLYPMLYVLFASVSDPIRLMQHNGALFWPLGFSPRGYETVLRNPNILSGYENTLLYVVLGTAINISLTTLGAYALSRKGYPFRTPLLILIVFTMYFGGGLIPNFLVVRGLGMYGTIWALLIPSAINTWNLIVMRTAFSSVPESLIEAAHIDGANDWVILLRLVVPVSKATISVMLLFYAVGHWNSWFTAMVYLRRREMYPLQLILREILISNSVGGNVSEDADTFFLAELIKYSTIMVSTLPILAVYPLVQKYFAKGVMLGSVKG